MMKLSIGKIEGIHTLTVSVLGIALMSAFFWGFNTLEVEQRELRDDSLAIKDLERLEDSVRQWMLMGDLIFGGGETYLLEGSLAQGELIVEISELLLTTNIAWSSQRPITTLMEEVALNQDSTERMGTLSQERDTVEIQELLKLWDTRSYSVLDQLIQIREEMDTQIEARSTLASSQRDTFATAGVILSFAYIGLIVFVWAWVRQTLVRPLQSLTSAAERALQHDEEFTLKERGPLEVRQLTASTKAFIGDLEHKVQERTIELSARQEALVREISTRCKTEESLRESRSRLAVAQRMAGLGYWTWNTETDELTMSEELIDICDIGNGNLSRLAQFADLIDEKDRGSFDADLARVLKERTSVDADYRLRTGSGRLLHVHQQLNVEHADGEPAVVVATMQDVTAQKTAAEQIRRLAYFDSLTGLASRSYLYKRLDEMIRSARRRQEGFALFFMDLDGFKDVNDSLGHDEGDTLLKTIAERLTVTLRENDFLARLGGDEFCMLIEDVSDVVIIGQIATRCLESVEAKVELGASSVRPQVSIGISRFPEDGGDTHALLRAADSAMYAAKENGRHCFEFFDKDMTQRASQRLALAQELRGALQEGQFELYYQPQIALSTGFAVGYEALVRWNHPTKGLVPPNDFIPELERMGLINELGSWAVHQACQQIVEWRLAGMSEAHVSVNIAPTHFQSPDLVEAVKEALLLTGIAPQCLELEITETGMQYSQITLAVFEELKRVGVRLAIDDFGSGFSSLGSLKHLPVDCLKIDRVFISDLLNNPKDAVLLGTIMSMAHALDFHVVAEGVEELEQVHILQALGCDVVQGFYFSRPVPASEIPELSLHSFFPEDLFVDQPNIAKAN